MMKYKYLFLLCFLQSGFVAAQSVKNNSALIDTFDIEAFFDSITQNKKGKLLESYDAVKYFDTSSKQQYATVDSLMYFHQDSVQPNGAESQIQMPVVNKKRKLYNKKIQLNRNYQISYLIPKADSLAIAKEAATDMASNPMFLDWVFDPEDKPLVEEKTDNDIIENVRRKSVLYIKENAPELIKFHKDDLPDMQDIKLHLKQPQKSIEDFLLKQDIKSMPKNKIDITRKVKKWDFNGKISTQVSQSYISPNWYTGGTGNLSILGYVMLKANYTNKNIQFNNSLDWKLGFNSTTNDSLRFLNTNEDIFKITSKFGLKAFKDWYYTLSGEFSTQLFNTYVSNTRELSTALFSPIRTYLSLGMNYKYKKNLSLIISPFSYKYTYVMNRNKAEGVTESIADKFSIPKGKKSLHSFGSRFEATFAYSFSKELKMESKMYLYTDYKDVEFDWEIIGNFIATQYLTVQLSLHPRYDSSLVLSEGQKTRFQFREFTSIGFLFQF